MRILQYLIQTVKGRALCGADSHAGHQGSFMKQSDFLNGYDTLPGSSFTEATEVLHFSRHSLTTMTHKHLTIQLTSNKGQLVTSLYLPANHLIPGRCACSAGCEPAPSMMRPANSFWDQRPTGRILTKTVSCFSS